MTHFYPKRLLGTFTLLFALVSATAQDCDDEQPINDVSKWSTYACSGTNPTVGEVEDDGAVCGTAVFAELQQLEDSPFCAGLQITQTESPRFNADAEYRVRFRYRSDAERTLYYRMIPRALDNSDGGEELVAIDIPATTEYQQFDTIVTSNSGQDSMLYHLWMIGDDLARVYIDDFSMVQVGGECRDEDATYNNVDNYTFYGPVTISEIEDENAACNTAIAIEQSSNDNGVFDAGFEQQAAVKLSDNAGSTYRVGFRYRADAARTAPVIITSRKEGTFGTDDGPRYHYEELNMTTEYQDFEVTFSSELDEDVTDRVLHFILFMGGNTTTVYVDDLYFEEITPTRTENFTFYVHPDGSNDNDGLILSADGAFQTLSYGLGQLVPGDSLLVADGVYAENNLRIRNLEGTAERPTVFKSINPWGAKLEGDIQYNVNIQVENSGHVVVEGFEIYGTGRNSQTNQATGIQAFESHHVTIENNYVHDCGCNGISGRESDYVTIRRNVTSENAHYSPYNCSGISILSPRPHDDAEGTHILVAENVSFANEVRLPFSPAGFNVPTDGNGIILDNFNNVRVIDSDDTSVPPFTGESIVENNLVFDNGGAGIKIFEIENAIVRNNTAVRNSHVLEEFTTNTGEIALQQITGLLQVYNNLMVAEYGYRGQAFASGVRNAGRLEARNNLAVGGVLLGNTPRTASGNQFVGEDRRSFPQLAQDRDSTFFKTFEFTSVDDFKNIFGLREGSPAIDAAATDLAPDTDLNGVERPIGEAADVGAYEGSVEGVGELPEDREVRAVAVSADEALTVDGQKDGLYTGQMYTLEKALLGTPENAADLSARWTAAYTDEALYFYVTVTDDTLRNDSENIYEDDAVEFYFDANNAGTVEYDDDDQQLIIGYGETALTNYTTGNVTGTEAAFVDTDTGYDLEVAIPWSLIGLAPADSAQLGFDIHINDDDGPDDGGDADRDRKLTWSANRDQAWNNPGLFGLLTLQAVEAPPSIMGTMDSISVDGQMDEVYTDAEAYTLDNMVQPGIEGPEDFSGNWRAVYTNDGLYFVVSITDDVLVNDSDNWYEDDGVEIYIDAGNERADTYDANDHQLVIEYDGADIYDTKDNLGNGAASAIAVNDTGYVVEAFVPWTALSDIDPAEGVFFGLDVHGIDDDQGGGGNDGKLAWHTTLDESFKTPRLFAPVVLGEMMPSGVFSPSINVGKWLTVTPNPSRGVMRYAFDHHREGRLRLTDMNGRTVFERTVSGTRGLLRLENLANGIYLLSMRDRDEIAISRIVLQR